MDFGRGVGPKTKTSTAEDLVESYFGYFQMGGLVRQEDRVEGEIRRLKVRQCASGVLSQKRLDGSKNFLAGDHVGNPANDHEVRDLEIGGGKSTGDDRGLNGKVRKPAGLAVLRRGAERDLPRCFLD